MSGVVQVVLLAETVNGSDMEGIDNVALTRASSGYLVWRDQYWNSPDRENESISGVQADADGDGADNWCEYVAGTSPTNSNDFFRIESLITTTGNCKVVLRSQPGRFYGIFKCSSVGIEVQWEEVTNNIPGTGDLLHIPVLTETPQYFRAAVRRPE
jgi:hypothetical protein